jgi:hypothetical protein
LCEIFKDFFGGLPPTLPFSIGRFSVQSSFRRISVSDDDEFCSLKTILQMHNGLGFILASFGRLLGYFSGLPDGIFSYKKSQLLYMHIWMALELKMLVCFMAVWNSHLVSIFVWAFGISFQFWYIIP